MIDRNDYYPFGMNIYQESEFSVISSPLNYKFQEQELQETGFYAFKWRNYMPDVGRFFNIDPLSEKYAYQSHYNFSENRVINAREFEGLEAVNNFGDRNDDPDLVWARQQHDGGRENRIYDIEEVNILKLNEIKSVELAGITLPAYDPPTMDAPSETLGTMLADFRNEEAPASTGITGQLVKGFIDSGLDAANLIRNVVFDQKDYSGVTARMTNWDGLPLAGEEGLDRSMNAIMLFGSFLTGGATTEANAAKKALPSLDATGKVHGTLPKIKDLVKYSKDEISILLDELRQSVETSVILTTQFQFKLTT